MPGTGDKLMTASEIKEVTDTKLVKDFSSLTALSGTPATGDLVPIKSGNDTYKIDYNALASAILGQISSNGVVNVANGGTGSNSATGALSGLIGALDTSSGFSLSDTIPVSINGTAYTITGLTLSNVIVGGGTGVTAILPIANGGTGAASASAARTALDVYSKSETTSAISQSTASDWQSLTSYLSSLESSANAAISYAGKMRTINFQGVARVHAEGDTLMTLPQAHRPLIQSNNYFSGNIGGTSVVIAINGSTGVVQIYTLNGATSTARIYFSATYMAQ